MLTSLLLQGMGAPQSIETDSVYVGSHLMKGDWITIDPTSHPNGF